jgi:hypothetical protein
MSSFVNKGERFWDFLVPLSRGEILRFPGSSIEGDKFGLSGFLSSKGERCVDSDYLELLVVGERFIGLLW